LKVVRLPIHIVAIEEDGFHLIVKGEINGLQASFLIDTGASRTVFDRSWIEKVMPASGVAENEKLSVGLGTNSMPSIVTVIDLISFGHLKIKKLSGGCPRSESCAGIIQQTGSSESGWYSGWRSPVPISCGS